MHPNSSIRALCLLPALLLGACSEDEASPTNAAAAQRPVPSVLVATIERADVPVMREFVARTEARDTVVIQARVEAILQAMEFMEGEPVSAGQVLYRLDPRTYEAALAAAEAGLAKARADLKLAEEQVSVRAAEAAVAKAEASYGKAIQDVARLRPLAEQDAVPRQDLDTAVAAEGVARAELDAQQANLENSRIKEEVGVLQAQALAQAAEASVAIAQLDLDYCTITSPIDGLIGRTLINPGNLVGRGGNSDLVTVSSIDPMLATLSISEAEFLAFQKKATEEDEDRPVELVLADDSIYEHQGRIVTAERAVSLETGTLQLVAEFPNPATDKKHSGSLRAGQFGRVRATIGVLRQAVLVPQRAVMEQQGSQIVFVVGDDGKVALKTVQLSERFDGKFVVLSGLEGGERVIVEGQLKARPGMTVKPMDQPASSEPKGN